MFNVSRRRHYNMRFAINFLEIIFLADIKNVIFYADMYFKQFQLVISSSHHLSLTFSYNDVKNDLFQKILQNFIFIFYVSRRQRYDTAAAGSAWRCRRTTRSCWWKLATRRSRDSGGNSATTRRTRLNRIINTFRLVWVESSNIKIWCWHNNISMSLNIYISCWHNDIRVSLHIHISC